METAAPAVSTKRIVLKDVASSQIAAIGHDPVTNTLAIRFRHKIGIGSLYHYSGVTPEDFAAFEGAESIGKHFYAHIKPHADKYPYVKIDESEGA